MACAILHFYPRIVKQEIKIDIGSKAYRQSLTGLVEPITSSFPCAENTGIDPLLADKFSTSSGITKAVLQLGLAKEGCFFD
jgi:hypothetical protein